MKWDRTKLRERQRAKERPPRKITQNKTNAGRTMPDDSANKSYELPFIDLLLVLLDPINHPASISNQEKKNLLDRITQQVKGEVLKQGKGMLN